MDLFHFQEEAPGAVFWHPKGWSLFQNLVRFMRQRQSEDGYTEVNTPELMDRPGLDPDEELVVYRVAPLTYALARRFVRLTTYGMVNLDAEPAALLGS